MRSAAGEDASNRYEQDKEKFLHLLGSPCRNFFSEYILLLLSLSMLRKLRKELQPEDAPNPSSLDLSATYIQRPSLWMLENCKLGRKSLPEPIARWIEQQRSKQLISYCTVPSNLLLKCRFTMFKSPILILVFDKPSENPPRPNLTTPTDPDRLKGLLLQFQPIQFRRGSLEAKFEPC